MSNRIDSLTPEQERRVEEIRARYFREATSADPADRPRAEAAICRLYEIAGHARPKCGWVSSPEAGKAEYERSKREFGETCSASLSAQLGALFSAQISASLRMLLWDSITDSLTALLNDALSVSLSASLTNSLWSSIWPSFEYSFRASLGALVRDSLWTSIRDSSWSAYYEAGGELVDYAPEQRERFRQFVELHASCFAVWAGPGWAVLCERPTRTEVVDGKLVNCEWGQRFYPTSRRAG